MELGPTFAAAGIAAAVELTLVQPLDVVKTRLHLESSGVRSTDRFGGSTFAALRTIYASEGIRGLWRGFGSGLAVVVPRRGLKFAANALFDDLLRDRLPPRRRAFLAGGLAGACEAVVITPAEVIKVAMQSERTQSFAATSRFGAVTRAISAGGLRRWYSGVGATVAKHSIHSCIYFATFAELKRTAWAPDTTASVGERTRFTAGAGFVAAAEAVGSP